MPLGCSGRAVGSKTISYSIPPISPTGGMIVPGTGGCVGSTVAGSHPCSPNSTARSVPWPRPVAASDPCKITVTVCGSDPPMPARTSAMNVVAARIGPTVCDDDGPMPTLNKSTILMVIILILTALFNKQSQFRSRNDPQRFLMRPPRLGDNHGPRQMPGDRGGHGANHHLW